MKVLRCGVRAVGSREKTFMGKFQIGLISTVLVLIPAMAMAAATSCDKLASVALPNAKIDSAQSVPAGDFTLPAVAGGQWQVSTAGGISLLGSRRQGTVLHCAGWNLDGGAKLP